MTARIHETLVQRSEDWINYKLGRLSCSRLSTVMSSYVEEQLYADNPVNQKKGIAGTVKIEGGFRDGAMSLIFELLTEELTQEPYSDFTNYDMEQGMMLEPDARKIYEEFKELKVKEVGGIENALLWFSPDGLVGNDGLIEIKCPQGKAHIKTLLANAIPIEYMTQVQGGLWVSGRTYCDFISFNPDFPPELAMRIIRVYRVEEYITLIEKRVKEFTELLNDVRAQLVK